VFALILVGGSLAEIPITHEAFSSWVIVLIVGVEALEKVVATGKELA
jgi:hypothetical protein